jgi:predicted ArsR family transcriptional regulator
LVQAGLVVAAQLDERDREILDHLRISGVREIPELCSFMGVTRTAIRQRLERLESAGLVVAEARNQARGRPRNGYRVTRQAVELLGENYRQLSEVLWEAIRGIEEPVLREQMLGRVRDSLADRLRRGSKPGRGLADRVEHLADGLRAAGYRVETEWNSGLPILRETCCPYPGLADEDEAICQMERQAFEQVLGVRVALKSRCSGGQGVCEFQVLAPELTGADKDVAGKDSAAASGRA